MADKLNIFASVTTDNPEHAVMAAEALSRAVTGLALEGIRVHLSIGKDDEED